MKLRKLKALENKLNKFESAEAKKASKNYTKTQASYNQYKSNYITFLKKNNLWTEELEAKYFNKKNTNLLVMDKFDEDFAIRYTRAKIHKRNVSFISKTDDGKLKLNFKKPKVMYGDDKKKNYEFYMELMVTVEEICRLNKWTTRQNWLDKQVPINKYMKLLGQASLAYSEILKYYSKQMFDERKSLNLGR